MAWVYILQCGDGTLYTGCTLDLERRIEQHQNGKGAKYTRGRGPLTLLYSEEAATLPLAQKREHEIKRLTRDQKWELIKKTG